MIANVIITLWLLFILGMAGLALYRYRDARGCVFLFQNFRVSDIPYITINIQGHELNMIVDTGAAVSVVAQYALQSLTYEHSPRKVEMVAMTDETVPNNVVSIPFTVGNKEIVEDFVVHTTDDLANFMKMHGFYVHGILGKEFFEHTGCKIDYRKHSVTFY